jgi:hypothetical protein
MAFSLRRADLDSLFALIDKPPDSKAPGTLAGLVPMQFRDLILEKINEDSTDAFKGIAIYAASSAARPDSALLVHMRLVHIK